tara:strand:- start:883 stop:1527 length:645 start_codon:yes stop_codon:yes gene_type:complete
LSTPLFIVFEGIDGSGTTTQVNWLKDNIETINCAEVVVTREPGGTPLAESIRQLVLDPEAAEMHFKTELLLYAASRAQHVHELILPELQAGRPVLCDRYIASTLAYQGYGRGLDLSMIKKINEMVVGDCLPDLTIYLDLPVSVASQRRQHREEPEDRLERAGDELQARVAQGYRELAAEQHTSSLLLDGTMSEENLAKEIHRQLSTRWPSFPFK